MHDEKYKLGVTMSCYPISQYKVWIRSTQRLAVLRYVTVSESNFFLRAKQPHATDRLEHPAGRGSKLEEENESRDSAPSSEGPCSESELLEERATMENAIGQTSPLLEKLVIYCPTGVNLEELVSAENLRQSQKLKRQIERYSPLFCNYAERYGMNAPTVLENINDALWSEKGTQPEETK